MRLHVFPCRAARLGAASIVLLCVASIWCTTGAPAEAQQAPPMSFEWRRLSDLPRPLAGHAAGVSHGVLLVAGGSDFPMSPFEGGKKVWFDDIYGLEPGAKSWRPLGRLPHPLAYAAAAAIGDRLVLAGGSDGARHYADVTALEWIGGDVRETSLPPLPTPIAMAGAGVVGQTLFVVGGRTGPADAPALRTVWALDLSSPSPTWRSIDPLPAAGRILPVVSTQAGRLHVFSGAALVRHDDDSITREYLRDAYTWRSGSGWQRLAEAPHPIVGAPAGASGQSHVIVFGGDTGADARRAAEVKDRHPGFSRDILAYHTITDTWTELGRLPTGLVTTMAVAFEGLTAIVGGEDRPGHRSAAVLSGLFLRSHRTLAPLDYVVLAAYFIPLIWIGRHFSRSNASTEEFFLGGRRVPWWAAGLSIYGTQLSAITFLAIPAKAYAEDWVFFAANACIVLVAPIVVYGYLPFFRGLSLTSAYEYLEQRFDVVVRLLASLSFVLLQVARMAIVLFLPSLMLAAVTGVDVYASILLMGVLCTVYTLEGGMNAVVWTDVMQVIVLLGAALASLLIIVGMVDGGLSGIWRVASSAGKLHMFNWSWSATTATVWVVVVGNGLSNLVPYTADQAVIQRYLTTKDERQAARAVWSGALLTLPTSVLFFGVGTALYAFYRAHPSALDPAVATDATFSWFIGQQLPAGLSGLAIAGVFAAAMSTLSGSINSIATAIVVDVDVRFRPERSEAARMRLARWLTGIIGAIGTATALLLATWHIGSLWDTFLQALGLFGGGLAGVFALGIFTTRASARGALAGLIASGVILFFVQRYTAIHFFLYAGIGIVACLVVGYVVSLVTGRDARSLEGLTIHTRRIRPPDVAGLTAKDVAV